MITDYYGDGNRYRGVTSRGSKTRTIVIAGNAVLHDTANDREDADHKGKETRNMRKTFKFDATKRDPDDPTTTRTNGL